MGILFLSCSVSPSIFLIFQCKSECYAEVPFLDTAIHSMYPCPRQDQCSTADGHG